MTRVLVVVPAHEPLRESAARVQEIARTAAESDLKQVPDAVGVRAYAEDIGLDSRIVLDQQFAAVPLGDASENTSVQSLDANASDAFAVRADVPDEMISDGYVNGMPVFMDPDIAPFQPICGADAPVGGVAEVEQQHNIPAAHARGLKGDRVAVAIMDSGVSTAHLVGKGLPASKVDLSVVWNAIPAIARQGRLIPPGQHNVGHGTMCAYDALIAAPEARILDYPILHRAAQPAGSTMGGALSDALQAYAHLEAFWLVSFGPTRGNYDSLVINNSWGVFNDDWDFSVGHPGRYIDNPNHPFNLKVSVMARQGIDMIFAAGNCGSECPDRRCNADTTGSIRGANAHPDVLTLAGIGTDGRRIGYSSEGPPIAGMGAPQKPDIACSTHFLGSEAFGPGSPDTGTSTSSPVAAGCIAALRTMQPQNVIPPQAIFDAVRTTAQQPDGGGWHPQLGYGVLDLAAAATHLGV